MHIEKMHGCGNDFLLVSYNKDVNYSELAVKLCNRRLGIGADGLVVVRNNPLDMMVYNSDGSDVPMCTNGIICFAKYCLERNYLKRNKFEVITDIGKVSVKIEQEYPFVATINMGQPIYTNQSLYISDPLDSFGRILKIGDSNITSYSLFLGTIHTVIFVDDFECNALKLAEEISTYRIFNRKTNVNFVKIVNDSTIKVKTYERGVGWVLSSGSGASAAAVVAERLGFIGKSVNAILEHGQYNIEITKKDGVYISGPAVKVFECELKEE